MLNDLVQCPTCGWSVFKDAWICKCTIGAKDDPKPATAEPWKGECDHNWVEVVSCTDGSGTHKCDKCGDQRHRLPINRWSEIKTDPATWVFLATPDPIAEFNARRIAKREVSAEDREAYLDRLVREAIEGQRATERKGAPLARAMSLNLHHTISDLIRPWRGK